MKKEGVRRKFLKKILSEKKVIAKEWCNLIQFLLQHQDKENGWIPFRCLSNDHEILLEMLCQNDFFIQRRFDSRPKNNLVKEVLQEIVKELLNEK